jgi:hypothetical protein
VCPTEKGTGYLDTFIGVLEQFPEVKAAIEPALGDVLASIINQNFRVVGEKIQQSVRDEGGELE